MVGALPRVLIRGPGDDEWLAFDAPEALLETRDAGEVRRLLGAVEAALGGGSWVVGFLAYEAATGLDPSLPTLGEADLPLAWFGLFRQPRRLTDRELPNARRYSLGSWIPTVTEERHRHIVENIRADIARGDYYQVNFSFRLGASFGGHPWGLFLDLWRAQRGAFSAWIDLGDRVICSASPELFFSLSAGRLTSRPMKGTAPRGRFEDEDSRQAAALVESTKDRAENLMIVDMVRNDLGRVAVPGSVEVTELFRIERYDSLFQMTSTVEATTQHGLGAIIASLFPAASITGAPKGSAMTAIRRLEQEPRGIYTGAIGYASPDGAARFGVAIRTVTVDRERQRAVCGTGGGIVWDSRPRSEFDECATKTLFLTRRRPDFRLLETILWEPGGGYYLLDRHLDRLARSARYFGFRHSLDDVRGSLRRLAATLDRPSRTRLLLEEDGAHEVDSEPLFVQAEPWIVALSPRPVDSSDRFLFHKTTHRAVYSEALAGRGAEIDDVILWNEDGLLTESTRANLLIRRRGRLLTPPRSCGLLAGTYRAELLERGVIAEEPLAVEALESAEEILLINSVRRRISVRWVQAGETGAHRG